MWKTLLKYTFYALPLILFMVNFTEPSAAVVSTTRRAAAAVSPLKVRVNKSRGAAPAVAFGRVPDRAQTSERPAPGSTQEVKAYVRSEAVHRGVDPQLALWIVKHESSFNPRARGDGDASRGLWQISKVYHPEVSDQQAFGVKTSTEWSLDRIRDGKVNEWSTYRNCRSLYKDCPF